MARSSISRSDGDDSAAPKKLASSALEISMDDWFARANAAERDAMSALQLEYRFRGDSLVGNSWWLILQSLGFKHNGTTYNLPDSAPAHCRSQCYTGADLYAHMDRFAIPQLTSPFQEFPPCPLIEKLSSVEEQEEQKWWRGIRDEMIFRRFRCEIEGFQLKQLPPPSNNRIVSSALAPLNNSTNKRRNNHDAGAELFMHKKSKGQSKNKAQKRGSARDDPEFANIRFPTIQEYAQHVSSESSSAVNQQEALLASSFDEWKFHTIMNHSLLVYGVGSKRTLLNQFAEELEAQGESLLVIDGFHKDVTIDGILDIIVKGWMGGEKLNYHSFHDHVGRDLFLRPFGAHSYPGSNSGSDGDLIQKAVVISRALARRVESQCGPAYYLVLHNIDGVGLRNATAQEALAALVSNSATLKGLNAVRLVASVDHVNSPALLWDSSTNSQFQWIWKAADTHRPHVDEVTRGSFSDEKSTAKAFSRHGRDAGGAPHTEHKAIFTVLSSLAPRHTEALQQLAGLQANQLAAATRGASKKNPETSRSSWVDYKTLLRQCQRNCIVHADEQLRRFLQELKDHGVVEQNSGNHSEGDAAEGLSYRIPYEAQTLKDILEFSHNEG